MHRQRLFSTLIITSTHAIHSIFILPFKNQSSSHCISLSRFSNPFYISLSFHSHSSFQYQSSSLCISLSSSSNPFSIIHTVHSHSSFQIPSSSQYISPYTSNPFSIIHTFIPPFPFFHTPSHFSQPNTQSTPDICHYASAGAAYVYRIILGAWLNSSPFLLSASFSLHSTSIPFCYFIAIPLALSFTPPLSIPFAFVSSNKQPFLYIPTPLPIHIILFSLFQQASSQLSSSHCHH